MSWSADYDAAASERDARKLWDRLDVYRFKREGERPVFSVDTPPPYVSAAHLHVGHAMSYAQADFVVRYRRMCGDRIFYPMGFDDNGLPTERFVEKKYGIQAADTPRAEFVALCLQETEEIARTYEELWRSLGLSVDWSLRYSTIHRDSQATAQLSFIDLVERGLAEREEAPVLWCTECRTAVSQADLEDLERTGRLHRIRVGDGATGPLEIATTRPELLAACVALYCNAEDERYAGLVGGEVEIPIYGHRVPVLADAEVDPEFGTGLMMVCTFGDRDDVKRWLRDSLALRVALGPDGRFGELGGPLRGRSVTEGRSQIVKLLDQEGRLLGSETTRQSLGVHERCGTPIEFQVSPQWLIRLMERRDAFRRRARELAWSPEFMRRRLEDWIDGLRWDWNISRQRAFGVPFPVWYCRGCGHAILAPRDALPVDPREQPPPRPDCPECGGTDIAGETDVMDTWMTSSLTPQINSRWASGEPLRALEPMSLRVQAFEIIRTWLFYTLVKAEYHFDRLPWERAMISGWGLNEQGKKISKRDLDKATDAEGFNRYDPKNVIERFGADAVRLWAARSRLGHDVRYNLKDVRTARKTVVKLWNAARFVDTCLEGFDPRGAAPAHAERSDVDRWLLGHLARAIDRATAGFEEYEYAHGYDAASRFFWEIFCDRYLEMVKDRFLPGRPAADRASAQWTLWEALRAVLALFAPFAPFVTEAVYQRLYAGGEDAGSIHRARWPSAPGEWHQTVEHVDQLVVILEQIRALRTRARLHSNRRLAAVTVETTTDETAELAERLSDSLKTAARADSIRWGKAGNESGVPGIRIEITAA